MDYVFSAMVRPGQPRSAARSMDLCRICAQKFQTLRMHSLAKGCLTENYLIATSLKDSGMQKLDSSRYGFWGWCREEVILCEMLELKLKLSD